MGTGIIGIFFNFQRSTVRYPTGLSGRTALARRAFKRAIALCFSRKSTEAPIVHRLKNLNRVAWKNVEVDEKTFNTELLLSYI